MTESTDPYKEQITESASEIASAQAKAELAANGVQVFVARVHSLFPDGTVNLLREDNEMPDGTITPDNVPSVALDTCQGLSAGDTVYCLSFSEGNTLVIGRPFLKNPAAPLDPDKSDMTIQEMYSNLNAKINKLITGDENQDATIENLRGNVGDRLQGHDSRLDTAESQINNLQDWKQELMGNPNAPAGSDNRKGRLELMNERISAKASEAHKHPATDINNPPWSGKKHQHGWRDLPKNGVHDNDQHKLDYIPRAEAKRIFAGDPKAGGKPHHHPAP